MAKTKKNAGKKAKDLPAKSLTAKQAKQVVGGRKAGGDQLEYMPIKLSAPMITSVQPQASCRRSSRRVPGRDARSGDPPT